MEKNYLWSRKRTQQTFSRKRQDYLYNSQSKRLAKKPQLTNVQELVNSSADSSLSNMLERYENGTGESPIMERRVPLNVDVDVPEISNVPIENAMNIISEEENLYVLRQKRKKELEEAKKEEAKKKEEIKNPDRVKEKK